MESYLILSELRIRVKYEPNQLYVYLSQLSIQTKLCWRIHLCAKNYLYDVFPFYFPFFSFELFLHSFSNWLGA